MPLSKEAIREFKKIYREDTGKELSDQKALEKATNLLTLFNAIYRSIPKEYEKKLKEFAESRKSIQKR